MFALFQLISIPFIVLQLKFTVVVIVYDVCLLALLMVAVVRGKDILVGMFGKLKSFTGQWKRKNEVSEVDIIKTTEEGKNDTVLQCSKWVIAGWIIAAALLFFQMYAAFSLESYDGDDAYYVAGSVGTVLYDTMYMRDAYTGYPFTLETRHALSPVPVMISWMSRMTGIHPTIICHSVLGPVWIMLMYVIYLAIADRLFQKEKKSYRPLFMILIMIWFLFGNVSIFNAETFAMNRIWQGKGMLVAFIIPAMFLCFLHLGDPMERKEDGKGFWILLLCTVFAAVLATSISVFLTPIFFGMTGLVFAFREKHWKIFMQCCLCSIPALIYGVLYVLL